MKRIFLLDNYDSFTYNLKDYLLQTGVSCTVMRNDNPEIRHLNAGDFDGLVLSPGPRRPADAGMMMDLIKDWHDRLPVLGVCLGHQALGEFFGARLIHAEQPMHGKTTRIRHNGHLIFQGLPDSIEVMRYHSLLLQSLQGTPLQATALSPAGEIMAFAHENLPVTGVQFHPESILTEYGLDMIRNWVYSL